jgi:hypothetical protein
MAVPEGKWSFRETEFPARFCGFFYPYFYPYFISATPASNNLEPLRQSFR